MIMVPSLTVFVMAKNASATIARAIDSVRPYCDEVVLVDNDSTDDTVDVARDFCRNAGILFRVVRVDPERYPQLYRVDEPASYAVGEPLCGEEMPGPFTGKSMLADWAGARNAGWDMATKDFILFLDADDVLLDTQDLPNVLGCMVEGKEDVVASWYETIHNQAGRPLHQVMRERIARRGVTKWTKRVHEGLRTEGLKVVGYDKGLLVKDHKDNLGEDTRIANRNLKVLYLACREEGWNTTDPSHLMYLAKEARHVLPKLALAAGFLYLERSQRKQQRAWVLSMMGEVHDEAGRPQDALLMYETSVKERENAAALYKATRCAFVLGRYRTAIDLYEAATKAPRSPMEDHVLLAEATKILYAGALLEVGEADKAWTVAETIDDNFSKMVDLMRQDIQERLRAKES